MIVERVVVSVFDVRVAADQLAGHAPLPLPQQGPGRKAGAMAEPALHRLLIGSPPAVAADGTAFRFTGHLASSGHLWRRIAQWALPENSAPLHAVLPIGCTPPAATGLPRGTVWLWPFGGAGQLVAERIGPMDLDGAVRAAAEMAAAMPGRALGALWSDLERRLWSQGQAPQGNRATQRMVLVGVVAAHAQSSPPFNPTSMDRAGWTDRDRARAYAMLFGTDIGVDDIGRFSARVTHAPLAANSFALAAFDPPRALVFLTQPHREPGTWTECCLTNIGHCMMLAHVLAQTRRQLAATGGRHVHEGVYRAAGAALAALPLLYTRQYCAALLSGSALLRDQAEPLAA